MIQTKKSDSLQHNPPVLHIQPILPHFIYRFKSFSVKHFAFRSAKNYLRSENAALFRFLMTRKRRFFI